MQLSPDDLSRVAHFQVAATNGAGGVGAIVVRGAEAVRVAEGRSA
jgi:ABC-type proline/glycine betaine transport system permease subunit